MNINNNNLGLSTPVKKQWASPEIVLIAQNEVEAKHLPYIKESTGKYIGKTFYNKAGTLGTIGSGAAHKSLIS